VVQSKWWSKLEVHGDEGGHEMKMIKFQFRKEEIEIKIGSRQRYIDRSHFLFALKTPYRV
jgi:hypothetical protein